MNKFTGSKTLGCRKGFTLVELMVSLTEGTVLTALVLGIFTTSMVVGVSVGNYSDMNEQNKITMSRFESDFREATRVTAFSSTGVTAEVLTNFVPATGLGTASSVSYAYDAANKKITRNGVTVLGDVQSCSFACFNGNDSPLNSADAPSETRKVLITASMRRTNLSRLNSDYLVSAVVVIRAPQ